MAFDSFGNGGGNAWQTPAPAEKPESAAAAGHSLAPTMRVGGGPTDGCSSRPDLCGTQIAGAPRHRRDVYPTHWLVSTQVPTGSRRPAGSRP